MILQILANQQKFCNVWNRLTGGYLYRHYRGAILKHQISKFQQSTAHIESNSTNNLKAGIADKVCWPKDTVQNFHLFYSPAKWVLMHDKWQCYYMHCPNFTIVMRTSRLYSCPENIIISRLCCSFTSLTVAVHLVYVPDWWDCSHGLY